MIVLLIVEKSDVLTHPSSCKFQMSKVTQSLEPEFDSNNKIADLGGFLDLHGQSQRLTQLDFYRHRYEKSVKIDASLKR